MDLDSRDLRRFWSKVEISNGCWEWHGRIARRYGGFWLRDAQQQAHRVAYHNFIGPVPNDQLVCHHCDNPICVRPDHLFLGTNSDNRVDCIHKQRHNSPWGENHHMTKLTNDDVLCIRGLIASGIRDKEIGRQFGVSNDVIGGIRRGNTWKHMTAPGAVREKWNRARGERSSTAKLKEPEVWMIRHLVHHGCTNKTAALMFRVSPSSVDFIRRGITWQDVKYP